MNQLLVAAQTSATALGGTAIAQKSPPGLAALSPDPSVNSYYDGKIDQAERRAILQRFQNMRPAAVAPPAAASGTMPPPLTNR